ncbi:hypothetical protein ACLOJK_027754 [Asimina triloba]
MGWGGGERGEGVRDETANAGCNKKNTRKTQEKKCSNLEGEIEGDGGVVAKDAATVAPLKRKDAFFIDNPDDAVHRALESGRPSEDGGGKDGSLVEEKRFGEGSGKKRDIAGESDLGGDMGTSIVRAENETVVGSRMARGGPN